MKQQIQISKIMAGIFLILSGCVSVDVRQNMPADLFPNLEKGQSVAVSYIPEAGTGDITALGNLWRDRIEKILANRGMVVKARKDIVTLIDDMETFGKPDAEKRAWENTGADIVVLGNYALVEETGENPKVRVVAKAFQASDMTIAGAEEFVESLDSSWLSADLKNDGKNR